MGDEKFIKYFLCAKHGWNINSDEIKSINQIDWLIHYYFEGMFNHETWAEQLEPQAELIGMIANPEVFGNYRKYKDAKKKGQDETVISTRNGVSSSTETKAMFDSKKGIVDEKGNILISLNVLKRNNPEFKDFAVSL